MTRVLQTLALALLVLGFGVRVAQAGKPNLVILGLEVVDKGGGIDQTTAQQAKDFTIQLRAKASMAGTLIPHSDKELVDEKLLRNCNSADAACIAPIGAEFGAQYLIYGSLEKSGGQAKVALRLLNVATKQAVKNFGLELRDTSPAGMSDAAGKAYAALLGGDSGSLNINVQNDGVDSGSVMVNKDKKDLKGGHLMVKDLGPDRYTVVVDVTGFQRFTETYSLAQGEKKEVVVTLVPMPGSKIVPPKCSDGSLDCGNTVSHASSSRTPYKVVGYGALILAAAAGAVAVYETVGPIHDYNNGPAPVTTQRPSDGVQFGNDDCDSTSGKAVRSNKGNDIGSSNFDTACGANSTRKIAYIVGGVSVGVAVAALILAYRGGDDAERHPPGTAARKSKKPLIAVTPILSPDGGGATVRIDF